MIAEAWQCVWQQHRATAVWKMCGYTVCCRHGVWFWTLAFFSSTEWPWIPCVCQFAIFDTCFAVDKSQLFSTIKWHWILCACQFACVQTCHMFWLPRIWFFKIMWIVFNCESAALNLCHGCCLIAQVAAWDYGWGSPVPGNMFIESVVTHVADLHLWSSISIDNWQFQSCPIAGLMIVQWRGSGQRCPSKYELDRSFSGSNLSIGNWCLQTFSQDCQDCWWKVGSLGVETMFFTAIWTWSIGQLQLEGGTFWVEHEFSAGQFCALLMLRSLSDVADQQSNHGREAQCTQTIVFAVGLWWFLHLDMFIHPMSSCEMAGWEIVWTFTTWNQWLGFGFPLLKCNGISRSVAAHCLCSVHVQVPAFHGLQMSASSPAWATRCWYDFSQSCDVCVCVFPIDNF